MLPVGALSVLVTGDVYFTDGRMGIGLPHDARGWLGGEPQAWCPLQGLHYGIQSSPFRGNGNRVAHYEVMVSILTKVLCFVLCASLRAGMQGEAKFVLIKYTCTSALR